MFVHNVGFATGVDHKTDDLIVDFDVGVWKSACCSESENSVKIVGFRFGGVFFLYRVVCLYEIVEICF